MRLIFILFFSFSALSAGTFDLVNQEMKNGNYIYSLVILRNIKGDNRTLATRYFLEAICFTQVGDYSKALSKFVEAKKFNLPLNDYFYELGKSLYFAKEYEKSIKAFMTSIKKKNQIAGSLSYLALVEKSKKDFRKAKIYYQKILKLKNQSPLITQDAIYQIGSLHLIIAKDELKPEDLKGIVSKHVLPYFEKALKTSPNSQYSQRIEKNIEAIKTKYDLL